MASAAAARIKAYLRRQHVELLPVILLLGLLCWPIAAAPVDGTLDPSWRAALHLAAQRGLDFGSDIVFTYGPLGFLGTPWPWYGATSALALVSAVLVTTSLGVIVLTGARRVFPLWGAIAIAYLAMRFAMVLDLFEGLQAAVVAISLLVLLRRDRLSARYVLLAGLVAAVALLGKVNTGLLVFGVLAVTMLAVEGVRRGLGVFLAATGVAGLALWLATGQSLADIPGYIRWSLEIVRGYSDAMSVDRTSSWHWIPFAFVALVLLLAAYASDEARGGSRARQGAMLLIAVLTAFACFKAMIVRVELTRALGGVLIALFALAQPGRRREFLTLFAAIAFAIQGGRPADVPTILNPMPSVRAAAEQGAVGLRPWTWSTALTQTQQQLQQAYAIGPSILAAIGDSTVHVDPHDTGVAAAYPQLHWHPLPVFQAYTSYTADLDRLNAARLTGADAPERILREAPYALPGSSVVIPMTIDKRDRWFDGPAAMLQTFCRYDEAAATSRWEVLTLNSSRRCGAPDSLGTVTAALGATVAVPADPVGGRIVVVRVLGLGDSLLDRLVSTAYHSPEWYVTLNGTDKFRLVPGTASDGLLLVVPPQLSRAPGFLPPPVTSLAIAPRTRLPWQGPLTYEFLAVPLIGG
jgi:hypothetical protein